MTTAALPLTDQDTAAIRGLIEPWNLACLERDWDTLLSMCTNGVHFLPPGGETVTSDKCREFLEAFPTIKEMSWDIDFLDGRGDMAVLSGWVKQTLVIDGEDVYFEGKYCDLMRKGDDGKWRFAMIIWNSDDE